MDNKVVYIHRKETNGEIFYVGIGTPSRAYHKSTKARSKYWMRTYKKHGRYVEVLHTGLSQEKACDIEMDLIELIGRRDLGLGTLVNMTDGGEGTVRTNNKTSVDISTGIEYESMEDACNALGLIYTTITTQLRGASPLKRWNTLRYKENISADGCIIHIRKDSKIKYGMILDTNTNKIYSSMKVACEELNISYGVNRLVMCGVRKRMSHHTLYKLRDIITTLDGYEFN